MRWKLDFKKGLLKFDVPPKGKTIILKMKRATHKHTLARCSTQIKEGETIYELPWRYKKTKPYRVEIINYNIV